ncbi:MAG: hypothetical protein WCY11_01435 [Novosphingobium sp.]
MKALAMTALAAPLAKTFAALGGSNPLIRTGVAALGTRWAMRSLPVAGAVLAAGAALRYFKARKGRADARDAAQSHQLPVNPRTGSVVPPTGTSVNPPIVVA